MRRDKHLSERPVRHRRDCVQNALDCQRLVAYLFQPCQNRFVAQFSGVNFKRAHLFQNCGFVFGNRGGKRYDTVGNVLRLLCKTLAHFFEYLRYFFFGKFVERILGATDLVKHSHHKTRAAAEALTVYSFARAAYSPAAIFVLDRKHGSIGVLFEKFFHQMLDCRLDFIEFFKHNTSPS